MGRASASRVSAPRRRPGAAVGPGAELWRRCRTGDEAAWTEVYNLTLRMARVRCRAVPHEAEDVAQEVVEKLCRGALGAVADPDSFHGYVAVMAARAATDRLRSPWRRRRVVPSGESDRQDQNDDPVDRQADAQPDPGEVTSAGEAWAMFKAELARLPEESQVVLRAYVEHIFLDPHGSYKTLVKALGSNRGAVSSKVTRGLDQLRRTSDFSMAVGLGTRRRRRKAARRRAPQEGSG